MPLGQDGSMTTSPDFKRALTRVIEPTGGPGVELVTLEDAAPGVAALGLCRGAAAEGRADPKTADIEAATAQMERALRRDGWL
jgi:hypothetical protein